MKQNEHTINGVRYLSTANAASRLRVTEAWVRKLVQSGRLSAYRGARGYIYVSEPDIENYRAKIPAEGHLAPYQPLRRKR